MSSIRGTFFSLLIFFIIFIVGDNLIFSVRKSESSPSQMSITFRHAVHDDYTASPPESYIAISNATLDRSSKRFRTGLYGEVLSGEYNENVYAARCKYVFIGGSSTENRWVAEDKRWVAQLDKKFSQGHLGIRAINFGVGGQNLAQSLIRYSAYISSLKPQMVFVMHEANDISKFLKGGYDIPEGSLHNLFDRVELNSSFFSRLAAIIRNTIPFTSDVVQSIRNSQVVPMRSHLKAPSFSGMDPIVAAKQ